MTARPNNPTAVVVNALEESAADLRQRWDDLRAAEPKLRIRDAAAKLGVSEAELLATGCGSNVTRLEGNWTEAVSALPSLGRCMALTRNEHIVHERHGSYLTVQNFHGMGQVVGPDIDLRLFYSHWHLGFAVEDTADGKTRRSLQFFDRDGTAIHKVYPENSETPAWDAFVAKFKASNQSPYQPVQPLAPAPVDPADDAVDAAAFRKAWSELEDTHAFFGLLHKFGVGRLQALRLARPQFARQVSLDSPRRLLEAAASTQLPIMIFVGNPGTLQIHTGTVANLKPFGEWFNVLDPDFNLHLRESGVAHAWVVTKPTKDGNVTSLEIFDANGQNLALFFGKRKPGQPEDPAWRDLLAQLAA